MKLHHISVSVLPCHIMSSLQLQQPATFEVNLRLQSATSSLLFQRLVTDFSHLIDEFQRPMSFEACPHLLSATSSLLCVCCMWLSKLVDMAFLVTIAHNVKQSTAVRQYGIFSICFHNLSKDQSCYTFVPRLYF